MGSPFLGSFSSVWVGSPPPVQEQLGRFLWAERRVGGREVVPPTLPAGVKVLVVPTAAQPSPVLASLGGVSAACFTVAHTMDGQMPPRGVHPGYPRQS